jgi:hypothetical protein
VSVSTCLSLVALLTSGQANQPIFAQGEVSVRQHPAFDKDAKVELVCTQLHLKQITFGIQFERKDMQPTADGIQYRRLPASYYHPRGPVGVAMRSMNWFGGPIDRGSADVRLPACLVGHGAAGGLLPCSQLVAAWSEPSYAVLGLEAGTMAAYARPFQVIDCYEENSILIGLSMPKQGPAFFHYMQDATNRGAYVRVMDGPRRTTFSKAGVRRFYHLVVVETYKSGIEEIDHLLLTKQGMQMLMDSVAPGGAICYHVSNRYYDLPPVVADVAKSLGYTALRGADRGPVQSIGHYTSEWVMVGRSAKDLDRLLISKNFSDNSADLFAGTWTTPAATGQYLWTDEETNWRGLNRLDKR